MKKRGICLLAALLAVMQVLCACDTKEEPKQQMSQEPSQSVEDITPSEDPAAPPQNDDNSEAVMTKRLAGATAVLEGYGEQDTMEFMLKYNDRGVGELTIETSMYGDNEKMVRTFDGSLARCLKWIQYGEDGSEQRCQYLEYDAEGKLLRVSYDQWQSFTQYTYDPDGNLLQISDKTDDSENVFLTYTYEFYENGQKKRVVETSHGDETYGRIMLYNEQGLLIETVNTWNGSPVSGEGSTYQYDDNGNLIQETNVEGEIEYQYDAEDRLVRTDDWGEITEYRYDDSGRIIECIEYDEDEPDDLWSKSCYEYDAEGDLLQITTEWEDVTRTVSFRYEIVENFAFENETLGDYVEYVKEEIFMDFVWN